MDRVERVIWSIALVSALFAIITGIAGGLGWHRILFSPVVLLALFGVSRTARFRSTARRLGQPGLLLFPVLLAGLLLLYEWLKTW